MKCTLDLNLKEQKELLAGIKKITDDLEWEIKKIETCPPRDFVFNVHRIVYMVSLIQEVAISAGQFKDNLEKQFLREPMSEEEKDIQSL